MPLVQTPGVARGALLPALRRAAGAGRARAARPPDRRDAGAADAHDHARAGRFERRHAGRPDRVARARPRARDGVRHVDRGRGLEPRHDARRPSAARARTARRGLGRAPRRHRPPGRAPPGRARRGPDGHARRGRRGAHRGRRRPRSRAARLVAATAAARVRAQAARGGRGRPALGAARRGRGQVPADGRRRGEPRAACWPPAPRSRTCWRRASATRAPPGPPRLARLLADLGEHGLLEQTGDGYDPFEHDPGLLERLFKPREWAFQNPDRRLPGRLPLRRLAALLGARGSSLLAAVAVVGLAAFLRLALFAAT